MRNGEISVIAAACTMVLTAWFAFAAFMFDWDISDLRGPAASPAAARPVPVRPVALEMRRSLADLSLEDSTQRP